MQLPMNFAGSDPWFVTRLQWWMALPLLGIGIAGLTTHFCLTNAFRHGDASVVIPLDFLRVPFIAMIGALFYAEPLDGLVFAGGGLILSGIVWNLRASVPIRKFAPACSTTDANFGIERHQQRYDSSAASQERGAHERAAANRRGFPEHHTADLTLSCHIRRALAAPDRSTRAESPGEGGGTMIAAALLSLSLAVTASYEP